MEAGGRGPEGLKAIIRWLHRAFTEMRFEFREILVVGDRAVGRSGGAAGWSLATFLVSIMKTPKTSSGS